MHEIYKKKAQIMESMERTGALSPNFWMVYPFNVPPGKAAAHSTARSSTHCTALSTAPTTSHTPMVITEYQRTITNQYQPLCMGKKHLDNISLYLFAMRNIRVTLASDISIQWRIWTGYLIMNNCWSNYAETHINICHKLYYARYIYLIINE